MARIERRERMRAVVERWRRSGMTAAAFCRRHGIRPQKLSYWKRALGDGAPTTRAARSRRGPRLVPVRLLGAGGAPPGGLEITLASGDRVVLHEGTSGELLREALAVLRERC